MNKLVMAALLATASLTGLHGSATLSAVSECPVRPEGSTCAGPEG